MEGPYADAVPVEQTRSDDAIDRASTSVDEGPGPLDGVLVLDFSRVLSGPICGRALTDLGAQVIKVEPPEGDHSRFAHPKVNSLALYFIQQNVGKRNISLDLSRPEAAGLLRRLASHADVVLENFRPGVMARLGLDEPTLRATNPGLVYASLSGYGQEGLWAGRRAYAVITHAEMGVTAGSIAHRGGEPANEPYSHADVYAGLLTLSAILAALHQRDRTGEGQRIEVSMAESLLFVNEHVHTELAEGIGEARVNALAAGDSPVCATGEGHLVTIAGHPCATGTFERFCTVMGRDDLRHDPRFATEADRLARREELYGAVRDWVRPFRDLALLEQTLADAGFAMGVVRTVREVANSEWATTRGAIARVPDRRGGTVGVPNSPWRFSRSTAKARGVPAYRGEHNREILAGILGMDDAELDRLEAAGVLSSRVPTDLPPGPALASGPPG